MKAKSLVLLMTLATALAFTVACNRGVSDAQVANQIQNKIAADQGIQSRQITVQSANGVVTLNGTVNNDTERAAAANDAAQVAGVRTVVNNLQVQPAATAQAEPVQPPVDETPAPAPRESRRAAPRRSVPAQRTQTYQQPAPAPMPATTAQNNVAPMPATPPPPAPVRTVTVPDGVTLAVRLIDGLDSERNQPGDTFRGSLSQPLYVGDEIAIPQGADIEGRVVDVKSAGHFAGQSVLTLELTSLSVNGKRYGLQTSQWSKEGSSRGKRTAATVGGGAALGAIIGGIAGGGKGAAIGSVIGAGAGTGVQGATRGQQITLPTETVLNFRLENSLNVVPTSTVDRGRQRMTPSDQGPSEYNDNSNGNNGNTNNSDRPELKRRPQPQEPPHGDSNDDQPPVLQRRPQ